MTADPQSVSQILDELATPPANDPPAVDPKTLLQQATQPAQPAQPAVPAVPVSPDPQKFGQLLNENAELRRNYDLLKADVEAIRAQNAVPKSAQPPQQVTVPDDGGWSAWGKHQASVVNETDDATWIANPKEAVAQTIERVLTRAGRDMVEHSRRIAQAEAWQVGTAMQADNEFSTYFPDLMQTEMGQFAVRQAIGAVVGDQRFQNLMRSRSTRPQAYAVVAKIANQQLGRNADVDTLIQNAEVPTARRSIYAERGGSRPTGPGTPVDQDKSRQDVTDYLSAHR